MKILDATCGFRGIWYIKKHPLVTYMDKRKCIIDAKEKNGAIYNINPDVVSEWKDTPFPDGYFDVVIFDPPHKFIHRDSKKKLGVIEQEYGLFYYETWQNEIKTGVAKLFDVLKPGGLFILKWNENMKPVKEVIKLFPYPPAFGTRQNQPIKGVKNSHWIFFLKYDVNNKLNIGDEKTRCNNK